MSVALGRVGSILSVEWTVVPDQAGDLPLGGFPFQQDLVHRRRQGVARAEVDVVASELELEVPVEVLLLVGLGRLPQIELVEAAVEVRPRRRLPCGRTDRRG